MRESEYMRELEEVIRDSEFLEDGIFRMLPLWREAGNSAELVDRAVQSLRKWHCDLYSILRCFKETSMFPKRDLLVGLLEEYADESPTAAIRLMEDVGDALLPQDRKYWREYIETRSLGYTQKKIADIENFLYRREDDYFDGRDPIEEVKDLYEALEKPWKWSEHRDEAERAIGIALREGEVDYAFSIEKEMLAEKSEGHMQAEESADSHGALGIDVMCARHKEDALIGAAKYIGKELERSWSSRASFADVVGHFTEETGLALDWESKGWLRQELEGGLLWVIDNSTPAEYLRLKNLLGSSLRFEGEERAI